jgi:hypothetical protein
MAQTLSPTSEAGEVQRQMREVRQELREDVQEIVVNAHQMSDWTIYVRAYPWLCVGAAVAAGFLLVPQRSVVVKPDAEGLIELAKRHKLVVNMHETPPPKKRGGLLAQLLNLAAATLLQGGMKVVSSQLTQAMGAATEPRHNGRPGVHHE